MSLTKLIKVTLIAAMALAIGAVSATQCFSGGTGRFFYENGAAPLTLSSSVTDTIPLTPDALAACDPDVIASTVKYVGTAGQTVNRNLSPIDAVGTWDVDKDTGAVTFSAANQNKEGFAAFTVQAMCQPKGQDASVKKTLVVACEASFTVAFYPPVTDLPTKAPQTTAVPTDVPATTSSAPSVSAAPQTTSANSGTSAAPGASSAAPQATPTAAPSTTQAPIVPTTQPTAPPVWQGLDYCAAVYGNEVPLNDQLEASVRGHTLATRCPNPSAVETYHLIKGPATNPEQFLLNQDGRFTYVSSTQAGSDGFDFYVACDEKPLCQARQYFIVSDVVIVAPTLPPDPTAAPLQMQQCDSSKYEYAVRILLANKQDNGRLDPRNATIFPLANRESKRQCYEYESFEIVPNSGPYFSADVSSFGVDAKTGDVTYTPPYAPTWDNFTFIVRCKQEKEKLPQPNYYNPVNPGWVCKGTARILAIPTYAPTPAPPTTPAPIVTPSPPEWEVDRGALQCRGSCSSDAWKAMHFYPDMWDTSFDETGSATSQITPRADGKPIDGIEARLDANGRVEVKAFGKIGNNAVRFPTFEPIPSVYLIHNENPTGPHSARTRLDSQSIAEAVHAHESLPFETSCLNKQASYGAGEQVWWWTNISAKTGSVGYAYNRGHSFYQKFGGKHQNCDVFDSIENACRFAPFLTPRAHPSSTNGWSLQIDGCDTKWVGRFSKEDLLTQTLKCGCWAWRRLSDSSAPKGTLDLVSTVYSEGLKPASWVLPPKGFKTDDHAINVRARLREQVDVKRSDSSDAAFIVDRVASRAQRLIAGASSNDERDSITFAYDVLLRPNSATGVAIKAQDVVLIDQSFDAIVAKICGPFCAADAVNALKCSGFESATNPPRPSTINGTDAPLPPVMTTAAPNGVINCIDQQNDLLMRVELGPAAVRRCPLSKPFQPAGVAGISDTESCAESAALARRDGVLNVTIRVTIQRNGTVVSAPTSTVDTAAVPFFPEGSINFAVRSAVAGRTFVTQKFSLNLGSTLETVSAAPASVGDNDKKLNALATPERSLGARASVCVGRPSRAFPMRYIEVSRDMVDDDTTAPVCVADAIDGGASAATADSAPSEVGAADRVSVSFSAIGDIAPEQLKSIAQFARAQSPPLVDDDGNVLRRHVLEVSNAEEAQSVAGVDAPPKTVSTATTTDTTANADIKMTMMPTQDEDSVIHSITVRRISDGAVFVLRGAAASPTDLAWAEFAPFAKVAETASGVAFSAGTLCDGSSVLCELDVIGVVRVKAAGPTASSVTAPGAGLAAPATAFEFITVTRRIRVNLALTPYVQNNVNPRSLHFLSTGEVVPESPKPLTTNAPAPKPVRTSAPSAPTTGTNPPSTPVDQPPAAQTPTATTSASGSDDNGNGPTIALVVIGGVILLGILAYRANQDSQLQERVNQEMTTHHPKPGAGKPTAAAAAPPVAARDDDDNDLPPAQPSKQQADKKKQPSSAAPNKKQEAHEKPPTPPSEAGKQQQQEAQLKKAAVAPVVAPPVAKKQADEPTSPSNAPPSPPQQAAAPEPEEEEDNQAEDTASPRQRQPSASPGSESRQSAEDGEEGGRGGRGGRNRNRKGKGRGRGGNDK